MKMTDILEQNREKLISQLAEAGFAEKAVPVLEKELDRLLLAYNDEAESDRERAAAAHLTQTVKLALPLMDSNGETKVWERGGGIRQTLECSFKVSFLVFLLIGLALCGIGMAPLFMKAFVSSETSQDQLNLLISAAASLAGIIFLYFAGYRYSKPRRVKAKPEYNVEIRIDPEKVYRSFRIALVSVDRSLEEIRADVRWKEQESAGSIDGREVTDAELDIFAGLIEASYSGDADFALEKIDDIKYFLHKHQIDVIDYSDDTAKYFDLMPGTAKRTIKPALTANGELLRKGVASAGR